MFLRFSIFLGILIGLTGCTLPGTQTEQSSAEGLVSYIGSGFSIDIPEGWVTTPSQTIPTPKNGTVVLTAISPEVRYGFSNNIIVMKDSLDTPVTSKKYSELNQLQTTRNYLEYTKILDDALLFGDDDESRVSVFEAKYNTTTSRMKFIQTAKVCGTSVYLVHAAIALDKNSDNYIDLFRTFECQ